MLGGAFSMKKILYKLVGLMSILYSVLLVAIYTFLIFYYIFSCFFDISDINFENPFDYARITDVDYTAVVVDEPNNSGKIVVTERLTYDIHAASKNNLFWELWRELPESYVDGLYVKYKVNSVKQILSDGTEVIYEESPKLYWYDSDYVSSNTTYGPGKWYHSEGPYSEYRNQYECVLFYVDGLYRDEVVFEIEYEMNNASFRYGDCSQLYITPFSEDSTNYLKSFKGQILFPLKDMPSEDNYYYYTYGTQKLSFPVTKSFTENPGYCTFSFDLDKDDLKFNPHTEYLEFSLVSYGDDKHIFTDFAPKNRYYNDIVVLGELKAEHDEYISSYKEAKQTKLKVAIICIIGAVVLIFYTFDTKNRMNRKYTFPKPITDLKYYRDIPSNADPNFIANLVFCKQSSPPKAEDCYSAILLSLIRKKYIELKKVNPTIDWTSSNTKIIIKNKPNSSAVTHSFDEIITSRNDASHYTDDNLEPLTKSELAYFGLIARHARNNEILMSIFQSRISSDYMYTNTFVEAVENSVASIGKNEAYTQTGDFNKLKNNLLSKSNKFIFYGLILITIINFISYHTLLDLAFGGFTILGITLFICALYFRKTAKDYVLLTQIGEEEYAKWRGLYNFLNDYTLMSERTVIELPLWEQYLVYATAFGISDKVIKALKIRCPELSSLPEGHMLNNYSYCHSSSFRHYSHSFSRSARSASFSASGGYSGRYSGRYSGGRGGGGGGGGH